MKLSQSPLFPAASLLLALVPAALAVALFSLVNGAQASETAERGSYRITVEGEGKVTVKEGPSGSRTAEGTSFLDLRIERRRNSGHSTVTSGFHARAFFNTSDVANGATPSLSQILKVVEGYIEVLPDGASGIHVARVSAGSTWVAFGYGADEKASFADFPIASTLSTSGIGLVPNATLTYENRKLGFTIDGSVFSPQENGSYMDLDNQGYSIRVRKGIPISTHFNAEVMGSYANLYYPTTEEREHRIAYGAKVAADLGRGVQIEGLAEVFSNRSITPAAATEASGWLALVKVKKGRVSVEGRVSRTRNETGAVTTQVGVSGKVRVSRPGARVSVDVSAGVGRTQVAGAPRARPTYSAGIVLTRGSKKKPKLKPTYL